MAEKKTVKGKSDLKNKQSTSKQMELSENAKVKKRIKELKMQQNRENTLCCQIMPLVLVFVAVFLYICFAIPDKMGFLTEDNAYLSEIPLQFSQMLKKNENKYIVKFECGQYTTNDTKLKSKASKTEINYAIFAEVDADFASTLEDKAFYTLTGTYKGYVDKKLVLPSGKVFTYPSSCYKTSFDENGTVCLGGFLFNNISVVKTQISK